MDKYLNDFINAKVAKLLKLIPSKHLYLEPHQFAKAYLLLYIPFPLYS